MSGKNCVPFTYECHALSAIHIWVPCTECHALSAMHWVSCTYECHALSAIHIWLPCTECYSHLSVMHPSAMHIWVSCTYAFCCKHARDEKRDSIARAAICRVAVAQKYSQQSITRCQILAYLTVLCLWRHQYLPYFPDRIFIVAIKYEKVIFMQDLKHSGVSRSKRAAGRA